MIPREVVSAFQELIVWAGQDGTGGGETAEARFTPDEAAAGLLPSLIFDQFVCNEVQEALSALPPRRRLIH